MLDFKKQACAAVSVLLVSGLSMAPVQARDLMKPFDFNELQQQPQVLVKDYVNVTSPKTGTFSRKESIDGVKRVGIVGFQVVFSESASEYAQGSTLNGLKHGNFNDSRWDLQVNNLSPEVRQDITEKLYADFREKMAVAGFEVAPQEEITADANYQHYVQKLASGATTAAIEGATGGQTQQQVSFGKNTVWNVVPTGFPLDKIDVNSDIFAGAKPNILEGFGQTANALAKIGQPATVTEAYKNFAFTPVAATYFLDVKKLTSIGGLLPTNPFGSSKADSTFGLSASRGSNVRFYTRTGEGKDRFASAYQLNFILKHPIQTVEPVGAADFKNENIGTQVFTGVANMAFRSMGVGGIKAPTRVRKYNLDVDPAAYATQADKLLGAVNQMMVTAIRNTQPATAE